MPTIPTSDPATATGRAAERRQHILDVSRKLFIQNGFHGTGVAQIATATGVKVGQLYRDFASKEDIIAEIAFRDLSQFLDETSLQRAIEAGDMATVQQWILTFVSYDQDLDGYRLMPEIMAESSRNPRFTRLQEELSGRVRHALRMALVAFAPGDDYEAARTDLADLVVTLGVGLCQSVVIEALQGRDYQPLCRRLRAIVTSELDALRKASRTGMG